MKQLTAIIAALALAGFFVVSGCEKGGQTPAPSQPPSSAPTTTPESPSGK